MGDEKVGTSLKQKILSKFLIFDELGSSFKDVFFHPMPFITHKTTLQKFLIVFKLVDKLIIKWKKKQLLIFISIVLYSQYKDKISSQNFKSLKRNVAKQNYCRNFLFFDELPHLGKVLIPSRRKLHVLITIYASSWILWESNVAKQIVQSPK